MDPNALLTLCLADLGNGDTVSAEITWDAYLGWLARGGFPADGQLESACRDAWSALGRLF